MQTPRQRITAALAALCLMAGVTGAGPGEENASRAATAIDLDTYTRDVAVLASDAFLGRQPGTAGEDSTLAFLEREFRAIGCEPGNGDSFFQEVPLVSITTTPPRTMQVAGVGRGLSLAFGSEWVASTAHVVDSVRIDRSEVVFAGYGIVAPEYEWNDYAGVDVAGKTVVVLVNDPGFATGDSSLFTGRAMTYYGRWTYKFEEAARQGARGVLVVHETAPAGYPWAVIGGDRITPNFFLESPDGNRSRCALEGWISGEAARTLLAQAGLDYDVEKAAAARPGYAARPLGLTYSMTLRNAIERYASNNVVARWPGADRADEAIIYTAHWDHFGVDPTLEGDRIYNGARDNATGTAALLAIARGFAALPERPARSILFLAVTAEEQGLLGSAHYAANPVVPTASTVAVINMDALNIFGPMKDVTIVGKGLSELDAYVEAAAVEQGRYVRPDPEPEKGVFFRSDHFSFAKQGVPALYAKMGIEHAVHGTAWTEARTAAWVRDHYHKVSDNYDPDTWDLRGAVSDIRLLFRIGYRLAESDRFPNWYEGSEFRALRDADRAGEAP